MPAPLRVFALGVFGADTKAQQLLEQSDIERGGEEAGGARQLVGEDLARDRRKLVAETPQCNCELHRVYRAIKAGNQVLPTPLFCFSIKLMNRLKR
jgi:hypothetical protein